MALDTPDHIRRKQLEIIGNKTPEERFLLGCKTIDDVRAMVENSIRRENPGISEIDLKIAVFKRYYKKDFSEEEIEKITASMRAFHERQSQSK
jgi:hypothetical protein